jgi:hypothetical protein
MGSYTWLYFDLRSVLFPLPDIYSGHVAGPEDIFHFEFCERERRFEIDDRQPDYFRGITIDPST